MEDTGNTVSHSEEKSLWKRLWTSRKTDCGMNEVTYESNDIVRGPVIIRLYSTASDINLIRKGNGFNKTRNLKPFPVSPYQTHIVFDGYLLILYVFVTKERLALRSILILPPHLRQGLASGLFPSSFHFKVLYSFS
jgi:hypothetical protein